jgi:hypothetical protein
MLGVDYPYMASIIIQMSLHQQPKRTPGVAEFLISLGTEH